MEMLWLWGLYQIYGGQQIEFLLLDHPYQETAITGTPEQQRDAGISAEDRDPAPGREEDDEGGPGFLGRLAGRTKEFFGTTLGKGLVAGLALLGTYVFEDEIERGLQTPNPTHQTCHL